MKAGADPAARQVRRRPTAGTSPAAPQSLQQLQVDPGRQDASARARSAASPRAASTTGVFTNMAKLRTASASISAQLTSFDDFDAALAKIKATLPADEPVIMLGNKEQLEHAAPLGRAAGRLHARPGGPRLDLPPSPARRSTRRGNRQALAKLKPSGTTSGYLGRGDDYNGRRRRLDAANLFAQRQGRCSCSPATGTRRRSSTASAQDAAFFNMPARPESASTAAIGSASVPDPHLLEVQAAGPRGGVHRLHRGQRRRAVELTCGRLQMPAIVDTTAQPTGPVRQGEVAQSWQQLVDDGGLTFFHDWSSPTMLETIGQSFQELLAGKASVGRRGLPASRRTGRSYDSRAEERKLVVARPRKYARSPGAGNHSDGSDGPDRGRRSRIAGASPAIRRGGRRPGRAGVRVRAPGEPRASRTSTSCAGVRCSSRSSPSRRCLHRLAVVLRLGRHHGRHLGRPRQLPPGPDRRRRSAQSFAHSLDPDPVFFAVLPCVARAGARVDRRARRASAASRFFRAVLFLPQVIAEVVVAVACGRWIYAPRAARSTSASARSASAIARSPGSATSPGRCPRSA